MQTYLLGKLEEKKRQLNLQIIDLKQQVKAVEGLILEEKIALSALDNNEVINKKNVNRMRSETIIMDGLLKSSGLETVDVIKYFRSIDPSINENTVRTHLSRMRDKEMIKKQPNRKWIVIQRR